MEKKRPIIALDFNQTSEVFDFLALFENEQLNFKIGMELFYSNGSDIAKDLVDANHDIFLT